MAQQTAVEQGLCPWVMENHGSLQFGPILMKIGRGLYGFRHPQQEVAQENGVYPDIQKGARSKGRIQQSGFQVPVQPVKGKIGMEVPKGPDMAPVHQFLYLHNARVETGP